MGKSTPSDAAEDDTRHLENQKSPDIQIIPRRFPRIGSQFQTRITKCCDPLDRQPPERMSVEYPYVTEISINNSEESNADDMKTGCGRFIRLHFLLSTNYHRFSLII
jgi:hypothetical protein